ncbi:MAG: glycosyltransferase [Aureliella sp.]
MPEREATTTAQTAPSVLKPLKVKFVITSLPVGGAETLLLNMVERFDNRVISAEVVCLKDQGELGPRFAEHVTVHDNLLGSKWDLRVLPRLRRLFDGTDAVITVGAGDKMFWGRLAARLAGVDAICSALHSTGWPDGVGKLNRLLTPITDGFIAVAKQHAEHLAKYERFPKERVHFIPNGVDTERFRPDAAARADARKELGISEDAPVVGIVAALREEKNHVQFVEAAAQVLQHVPRAHFVVVGDGPLRPAIEEAIQRHRVDQHFHLLGSRSDTPRLLAAMDVFCLTSKNEANPVSIMEALACQVPAVAPAVGSVDETVKEGVTGFLTTPHSADATANAILSILLDDGLAKRLGRSGRRLIQESWSLETMVGGYQDLIVNLVNAKRNTRGEPLFELPSEPAELALPIQAFVATATSIEDQLDQLSQLGASIDSPRA